MVVVALETFFLKVLQLKPVVVVVLLAKLLEDGVLVCLTPMIVLKKLGSLYPLKLLGSTYYFTAYCILSLTHIIFHSHLRENIGAFYRENTICGYNGCSSEMSLIYRAQKNQFYYRCRYPVPLNAHRDRQETITSKSIFYNRKKGANIVYCILLEYFRSARISDIFSSLRVNNNTISQVYRDCQAMMNSDYMRYHGEYLLGSNELCDHIQIDESKFGKRKNHRGVRIEGVWVFGMVEALKTDETYLSYVSEGQYEVKPKLKAGKAFVCTVPNRSAATLIPIIEAYCARGSVIRSDGWAAYSQLHPSDIIREDGSAVPANYSGYFFSRHEVVNHSLNFSTNDQVEGNQTVGKIHTNIIEGLWAPIKRFIHPRNRTANDCPGKLLEYMWRRENQGLGLITGMERCIREVQIEGFSDSIDESNTLITRAEAWDLEQVEATEDQPFQLEDDYDSEVSSDEDSDDDTWVPEVGSSNPNEGIILATSFRPSVVREHIENSTTNSSNLNSIPSLPIRHNTRPRRNNN